MSRSRSQPSGREFALVDFQPAYQRLSEQGGLAARAEDAMRRLAACRLCPRACGANRLAGETGRCGVGRRALVASAFAHPGEEACLSGRRGSGTIFFGSCNLRCAFCQNGDISERPVGQPHPADALGRLMLSLQQRGCHNINLVTPSHVVPQTLEAIRWAAPRGLDLPIVYNTSGYDCLETLRLLDGVVDIYMPDFKFWRPETARRLAAAPDYPLRAREAIAEMHRQVGPLRIGPDGIARRGLLVRHLVMPGLADETEAILAWLGREISPDTFVNIMGQYRPEHRIAQTVAGEPRLAPLLRRPTLDDMRRAYRAAERAGLWRFDQPAP